MYENIPRFKERALECKDLLTVIDYLLDKLEKIDPYGDMVENFCEDKATRHTKRLIELIDRDLKELSKKQKKYGLTLQGMKKPIYFDSTQERKQFTDKIKGIFTYSTFTKTEE